MDILDSMEWGVVESDVFIQSGFDVPLNQIMMIHSSGDGGYVCVSPQMEGKAIFWRGAAPPLVEDFWTLYDLAVLAIFA